MQRGYRVLAPHTDQIQDYITAGLTRREMLDELTLSGVSTSYSTLTNFLETLGVHPKPRRFFVKEHGEDIKRWFREGLTDKEMAERISDLHGAQIKAKTVKEWRLRNEVVLQDRAADLAFKKKWINVLTL